MAFHSRRLHVVLGYACNHKCRYCIQEISGRPKGISKHVSERALDVIRGAADAIAPEKLRITLFGGEPLLYRDALTEILECADRDNITWRMHSNGELLDESYVDLFNCHNIQFLLSHDGADVLKTRGINVFEQNNHLPDLCGRLKNFGIEFVVTAYSQDFYVVHEYFLKMFGHDQWLFKPAFLSNARAVPVDLLNFDFEAWSRTAERICLEARRQIIERKASEITSWEAALFSRTLGDFVCPFKENPFIRGSERCLVPHVDLNGRVFYCERFESELHKAEAGMSNPANREAAFYRHTAELHPYCRSCSAFAYCRGQCPAESPVGAPAQCQLLKIFYAATDRLRADLSKNYPDELFEAADRYLPRVVAIEPSDLKPVRLRGRLQALAGSAEGDADAF